MGTLFFLISAYALGRALKWGIWCFTVAWLHGYLPGEYLDNLNQTAMPYGVRMLLWALFGFVAGSIANYLGINWEPGIVTCAVVLFFIALIMPADTTISKE